MGVVLLKEMRGRGVDFEVAKAHIIIASDLFLPPVSSEHLLQCGAC